MVEMGIDMYILVIMTPISTSRGGSWIKTPIIFSAGSLSLAGELQNVSPLDRQKMRILGKFALVMTLQGTGFYTDANGANLTIEEGDVIIVFPDLPHAYGPNANTSWQHAYVVFEGPQFNLLRHAGVLDSSKPIWHLEPIDFWRRRLEAIIRCESRPKETDAIRKLGQFTALLADMAATNIEANRLPVDIRQEESMQLLSSPHQQQWLAPQEVAQRVGLSYENFRKLFAKHVGVSPAQYQKQRRIEHACAAIYQNSHTFKELADELGFCDVFHFSKTFRQVVGDTPSAFRKKALGE